MEYEKWRRKELDNFLTKLSKEQAKTERKERREAAAAQRLKMEQTRVEEVAQRARDRQARLVTSAPIPVPPSPELAEEWRRQSEPLKAIIERIENEVNPETNDRINDSFFALTKALLFERDNVFLKEGLTGKEARAVILETFKDALPPIVPDVFYLHPARGESTLSVKGGAYAITPRGILLVVQKFGLQGGGEKTYADVGRQNGTNGINVNNTIIKTLHRLGTNKHIEGTILIKSRPTW